MAAEIMNQAKTWIANSKSWLSIIGFILLGAVLLLLGEIVPDDVIFLRIGISNLSTHLGQSILSGIFGGVILKIMDMEGVFIKAIVQATYGKNGLDWFSEEKLKELLREVTTRVYLPFRNKKDNAESTEVAAMRRQFYDRISEKFQYDADFFISRSQRDLVFRWVDERHETICLSDHAETAFIPFDKNKEIQFTNTIKADGDQSISLYKIVEKEYKFADGRPVERSENAAKGAVTTIVKLGAGDKHELIRSREITWSLDVDPIYNFITPYLIQSAEYSIENKCDGITLILRDVGDRDIFRRIGGGAMEVNVGEKGRFKSQKILLPEQGINIVLVRKKTSEIG